jgi:8-oxo-dGTP pyrophosphatase MutT (NUDIX family)
VPLVRACCSSKGDVLLLKRRSKHNDATWGLPGGNEEQNDGGELLSTATREAREELGMPPPFAVAAQLLTRRGKRLQKHYTVFIAHVDPAVRQTWVPQLNEEHSDWRWVPWGEVLAGNLPLHPVTALLAQQHAAEVASVLSACPVSQP